MTKFLVFMLLFIPSGAFALFLHELSHYLVLRALGYTITSFRPYPHRLKNGLWVWGAVSYLYYLNKDGRAVTHKWDRLASISPLFFAVPLAALFLVLSLKLSLYFLPLYGMFVFDTVMFWVDYFSQANPNSDGYKFRNAKNVQED